ncbi:MAG: hypothetical protein HFJ02_00610 [Bacilli bacterium]|nr:hypothetical protein [Bacilli bacterium]
MDGKDVFKISPEDIDYITEGRAFVFEKNGEVLSVSNVKQFNELQKEGYTLRGYKIDGTYYQVGDLGKTFFEDKDSFYDEEDYFDDYDCNENIYEYAGDNSLFWENDVREFLLDRGLSKKGVEKILTSIHLEPQNGEKDFIIDYYQLRPILFNLGNKFLKEINTLSEFKSFLYPRVSDDFIKAQEFETILKNFKIKKKEIKNVLNSLHKMKDYSTKCVYFSKEEVQQIMIERGYSHIIYENMLCYPKQNYFMNEILALCFKNTGKVYLSTDSLYEVSEKLFQLIKIGPKNTKFIAEKVKIMADIIEEMKKNHFNTFDYYTNKYPLLSEFIDSISFHEGVDAEFIERHTDLTTVYQYIKKLINRKKIETYAKEQGIEIQKNEDKNNKKEKTKFFNKKINALKEKFIYNKSGSKQNQRHSVKDFIGEKINDFCARRLSYAIYKNSKKYAFLDVTQLTCSEINSWMKVNQKLMRQFEKYNKSKYCSVSLPFTADIDIMEYLFNTNRFFEQILTVSPAFLVERNEVKTLDAFVINYLALAKDQEKALFESYENQNEIKQYVKKRTRNRIVTALGGIVATLFLTSFGSGLSFKNHSEPNVNDTEITNDLDIESLNSVEMEEELNSNDNAMYPGEIIIEGIVNEIEHETKTLLSEEDKEFENEKEENQESVSKDNAIQEIYPGEVVIEGIIVNEEKETPLNEISFIPIGDDIDTLNNADVYCQLEDLASLENSTKSYWGSNENLGRTVKGIAIENEKTDTVKIVYSNEEVINYLVNDYDVIGYQVDNMFSYNQNGTYAGSEGLYDDESVIKLTLKK